MIRQPSAWGQFWVDLADRHHVYGCGIFTPSWHQPKPTWRGKFHSTWHRRGVYYSINGETMWEMLRDGLDQTGTNDLHMKLALLAALIEHITDWSLRNYR